MKFWKIISVPSSKGGRNNKSNYWGAALLHIYIVSMNQHNSPIDFIFWLFGETGCPTMHALSVRNMNWSGAAVLKIFEN